MLLHESVSKLATKFILEDHSILQSLDACIMSLRESRTASAENSIWLNLPEDEFRQNLVTLEERTNTIPMDPCVFNSTTWDSDCSKRRYMLPLELEQQVADDFACLVAVAEGAQSVAAVCIEQCLNGEGITLRFAAMDLSLNESVKMALQASADVLQQAASSSEHSLDSYTELLFDILMKLHESRMLARLRSQKWEKPKYLSKSHKKPLWQDFANLAHRAQLAYQKHEKNLRSSVETQIKDLSLVYKDFETAEDNLSSLKSLVDASFKFCSSNEIKDYLQRLLHQTKTTSQIAAAIKSLRQIQKITAHRRIATSLITTAKAYPTLFRKINIAYLTPYKSVPTTIGYHEWAKSCHLHAEVQLAVYYDLNPEYRPRVIGISKWLCYLCYRFLEKHGMFFPSKTHGQLFDQWTVPDLEEFGEEVVGRYRRIVEGMNEVVVGQIAEEPMLSRLKPMTSCTVDHLLV